MPSSSATLLGRRTRGHACRAWTGAGALAGVYWRMGRAPGRRHRARGPRKPADSRIHPPSDSVDLDRLSKPHPTGVSQRTSMLILAESRAGRAFGLHKTHPCLTTLGFSGVLASLRMVALINPAAPERRWRSVLGTAQASRRVRAFVSCIELLQGRADRATTPTVSVRDPRPTPGMASPAFASFRSGGPSLGLGPAPARHLRRGGERRLPDTRRRDRDLRVRLGARAATAGRAR